jgi:hypothetical protein
MARACGTVVPTFVEVLIPDPTAQITAGFTHVRVYRSNSGSSGPWTEATTELTWIPLVSKVTIYDFVDPSGSKNYWYRWATYNPSTHALGPYSAAVRGTEDACLEVLSIDELKSFYLFGVNMTDDYNTPYPDALFVHYIRSAVSFLEMKLDISIRRRTILSEMHDWERESAREWLMLQLWRVPVISVERVRMVLPDGTTMRTFPKNWIHVQRDSGQLQLIPGGSVGPLGGQWAPIWSTWMTMARAVPDMLRIDYTAGFGPMPEGSYEWDPSGPEPDSVSNPNPEIEEVPGVIKDMVGKLAAFGPLNIAGDLLVGAGIASQSLSIDGLSQSIATTSSATNAGYGARLLQYQKELKDNYTACQRWARGPKLMAV